MSSVASASTVPASFDPLVAVQLALKPKDHDPSSFATILATLKNQKASIYDRGLSAWAIGRILQLKSKDDKLFLRQEILNDANQIMDDLVDIIGASKLILQQQQQNQQQNSSSLAKNRPKHQKSRKKNEKVEVLPSVNDVNKISKNCSLVIIMLSEFLSDPNNDPFDFVPPTTPLQRMAATPEPSKSTNDTTKLATPKRKKKNYTNRSLSSAGKNKITTSPQVSLSPSSSNDLDSPNSLSSPENDLLSNSSSGYDFPEPRTYFKRTDNKKPDLLLYDYMKQPEISFDDTGPLPKTKKTMNPENIAGELTTTTGQKIITLSKNPNHPSPRTSVLFSDQPARDVHVPGVKSSDFFTKDDKLGYQIPRLYLDQNRPFTSSSRPGFPEERKRGMDNAKRPHTSDYIRDEYQKIEAKFVLDNIRDMEAGPTGWYELPPDEDWKKLAENNGRPIWTPSKGIQPKEMKKAWLTGTLRSAATTPKKSLHENNMNSTSTNLFVASSPTKKAQKTENPYDEEISSPTPKIQIRKQLAGEAESYENRAIQRNKILANDSSNFAFFTPVSPPTLTSPLAFGSPAPQTATSKKSTITFDESIPLPPSSPNKPMTAMSALTSPGNSPSRGNTPFTNRPVSPYELDAFNGQEFAGTMVPLDDYNRLLLSTAQSKRAEKRAGLASAEAKEEYRRRRLHAIVRADDTYLPEGELHELAEKENSILKLLQSHERNLLTHSTSLQNKINASIAVQHKALPLRFLFTVEGGAEFCRKRLQSAFGKWVRGFELAQMTVGMAMFKMNMDEQIRREQSLVYRQQAGRRLLKVIILEIDLRLYKRTFERWSNTTSWLIYKERDEAAVKIQATILRYQGLVRFINLHDVKPIGGPLSDIPLAPYRHSKDVTCRIYPRIRTERRRFWNSSLSIQTRYRMVTQRNLYVLMKASSIICESVWRMYVKRREYMKLRYFAIVIESAARMCVKKWQYKKIKTASVVAIRVYRGHLARMEFLRRQKARRIALERLLSAPPPIQRRWRVKMACRVLEKKRADKIELFYAAVRLQCFWYKHQGNFPTFVLLGCLRETDALEKAFNKKIKLYGKAAQAKKIQRMYRDHLQVRHDSASLRIQCMARAAMGTDLVERLRREKWANRKLRYWSRGMMKKRKQASSKIAFGWWRAKKGRFLNHLIEMSQKEDNHLKAIVRAKKDAAATTLQAITHGVWTRRHIGRTRSAIKIQKIMRGYIGKRIALNRLRDIQNNVVSKFMERMLHQAKIVEMNRIRLLKKTSATKISSLQRGFSVRLRLYKKRKKEKRENDAATFLQIRYRKMIQVKRARTKLLQMKRKLTNPFREEKNLTSLVDKCLSKTMLLYHPENVMCGVGLESFCQRLGIRDDVYPVITKNKVLDTQHLFSLNDAQLRRVGINEEVKGDKQKGIFHAEDVRNVILKLGAIGRDNIPHAERTEEQQQFYDDFMFLSHVPQLKALEVKRVFEGHYGERYASRANHFAQGQLLKMKLTTLQLKRFFAINSTPGKAKDNAAKLLKVEKCLEELNAFDSDRIESCGDVYLYASEQVELMIKGWSNLYYKLHSAVLVVQGDTQKKKKEQDIDGGPTLQMVRSHHIRDKECCVTLHKLLMDIREMDIAARVLQNTMRGCIAFKVTKLVRERKFVDKVKTEYLYEKNHNFVMDVYKSDRQKEQEEYERQYKEWLLAEEKASIEFELKDLTRYGWEEEWRTASQQNDEDQGWTVWIKKVEKRVKREIKVEELVTEERPIYTYEEYMASKPIQNLIRRFMAKTMVKRIKRDRLKREKEAKQKEEWEKMQKQRKQFVTLKFNYDVVNPDQDIGTDFNPDSVVYEGDDGYIYGSGEEDENEREEADNYVYDEEPDLKEEEAYYKEVDNLIDNIQTTKIDIGFPLQALFDRGEIYYSGTVFQVNPTEYISSEGIKFYPKNTFGVLYDDGDFEPAVHRNYLRVVRVKEGMTIEAQCGGTEGAFYTGVVVGVNERDGKTLSYQVKFEDGTEEKAVVRRRIRVSQEYMSDVNDKLKKLEKQRTEQLGFKAKRRKTQIKKWLKREQKLEQILIDYENHLGLSMSWMDHDAKVAHILDVFHNGWDERHPKEIMEHVRGTVGGDFSIGGGGDDSSVGTSATSATGTTTMTGTTHTTHATHATPSTHATRKKSTQLTVTSNASVMSDNGSTSEWSNIKNVSKMNINGMAKCSKDLWNLTRNRVKCSVTLKYTKQALPYGWVEKFNKKKDLTGYKNVHTKETRTVHNPPEFTFEEELATVKLQNAWRALEGKREFEKKLKNESILGVLKISVKEASKHAWLNYGTEGMTLEMWLARLGLSSMYSVACGNYLKEMRKTSKSRVGTRGSGMGSRRTSSAEGGPLSPRSRRESRMETPEGGRRGTRLNTPHSAGMGMAPAIPESPTASPKAIGRMSNLPQTPGGQHLSTPTASRGRTTSRGGGAFFDERGGSTSPDHGLGTPGGGRRRSSASPGRIGSSQSPHRSSAIGSRGSDVGLVGLGGDDGGGVHALTLEIFLKKCKSDNWLKLIGFKNPSDRHLIHGMANNSIETANGFKFLNYYDNESDKRSIKMCIKDNRETLYKIVLKKYKNNPNRVEKIVEELQKSSYPITLQQLTTFLNRYEGKPAMAQENVLREMVNIKTTSNVKDEKMAFTILKSGIDRVNILLKNLGVTALTDRLENCIQQATAVMQEGEEAEKAWLVQEEAEEERRKIEAASTKGRRASKIYGSPKGGSEGRKLSVMTPMNKVGGRGEGLIGMLGGGAARAGTAAAEEKQHSGHEAKAGLILRKEGCQVVINWWNSSLLCQKRFRGHRQLEKYNALVKQRSKMATVIQSNVRQKIFAKNLWNHLKKQQFSQWEQLFNEDENCFYWYNKKTQLSVWEEPNVPFRPMIRDRFTQKLMQAWPHMDVESDADKVAPPGICMICKDEDATRSCNECVQKSKKIKWGGGKMHFCFVCFSQYHSSSLDLRHHKFTITKSSVCKPLTCCVCASLATRRCMGMKIQQEVFDRLTTLIVECYEDTDFITEDGFVDTIENILKLGGYMSVEKMRSLFSDCKGKLKDHRSNSEVWKRFQEHLTSFSDECDENFCDDCYKDFHRKGRRSKHEWFGFAAGADVCVECEALPATKMCLTCRDKLCSVCASETHARGKKKRHVMTDVREELEPHQQYCIECTTRAGSTACNFCKMPLCDSCSEFKHKRNCKARIKLTGEDDNAVECSVCGKPPDTICVECGDVYCSIKWMGNPGCFKKMHKKGNRANHQCVPYSFLLEREEERRKEEEEARRKVEEEEEKKRRNRDLDSALDKSIALKEQNRKDRLALEAKAEFERRHSMRMIAATKGRIKLPGIAQIPGLKFLKRKIDVGKQGDDLKDGDGVSSSSSSSSNNNSNNNKNKNNDVVGKMGMKKKASNAGVAAGVAGAGGGN